MWTIRERQLCFKCLALFQNFRSYSTPSYMHNAVSEPLRALTLGKILENTAQRHGDRPAIVSRSQEVTLTFQQVLDQADRVAAGFRRIGLDPGDRIGIWAPNLVEWYVTHMACARGGYVLVNLNPSYVAEEVRNCINSVGLKGIVCPAQYRKQHYYKHLTDISPEILSSDPGKIQSNNMPSLRTVVIMPGHEPLRGTFSYEELFDLPSESDIKQVKSMQDYIKPDDVCHFQFTSGTTGTPKVPMQSHFQIANNSYLVGRRNELHTKHHTICMQAPFFHVFGTVVAVGGALHHAATLVLPAPTFNPDKSLDAICDDKCTMICGTPTMYVDLINRQQLRNLDIHPEIAISGGAPSSVHLFQEMKKHLNLRKVKSIYGLSESTAVVFQSLPEDDEVHSTSTVGYVGDHLEVKIVDAEGKIVPRGTPGELLIRGYSTTLGYWQNEEKTNELIGRDKWLRTGDQFILQEDGYGRIVGRIKDMIIRGGENIYPIEVENVLNEHPHVLEVQVVGLPHERLGEEVCACIRVQNNMPVTLGDLKAHCAGKLARFKIPSRLEIFDSFPKTASGKIQKYKIIETIVKER